MNIVSSFVSRSTSYASRRLRHRQLSHVTVSDVSVDVVLGDTERRADHQL